MGHIPLLSLLNRRYLIIFFSVLKSDDAACDQNSCRQSVKKDTIQNLECLPAELEDSILTEVRNSYAFLPLLILHTQRILWKVLSAFILGRRMRFVLFRFSCRHTSGHHCC